MVDEEQTERLVTYTVAYRGRMVTVKDVPARIDPVTGETCFAPATVEKLQAIVWSNHGAPASVYSLRDSFQPSSESRC